MLLQGETSAFIERKKPFLVGISIHLIKTHILMGDMLRSRSSFKVKGQIEGQCSKGDIAVSQTHLVHLIIITSVKKVEFRNDIVQLSSFLNPVY